MNRVGSELYTSRACKGSALLADTRALLRAWSPGEGSEHLARRAQSDDLLGKATAQRVSDVVVRVFAPRYLGCDARPARSLKRLLESNPTGDWFRDLCFVFSARADVVLRDAATKLIGQLVGEGRSTITVDTIQDFLRQAELDGRMAASWSDSVRHRTAKGIARLLTDFGLLSEPRSGYRDILRFRPSRLAVAFLAYELHFSGVSDAALLDHPDWRLWQLDREALRRELDDLSQAGLWIFQAAGSVVRISWSYTTLEEAVDACARLDLR